MFADLDAAAFPKCQKVYLERVQYYSLISRLRQTETPRTMWPSFPYCGHLLFITSKVKQEVSTIRIILYRYFFYSMPNLRNCIKFESDRLP